MWKGSTAALLTSWTVIPTFLLCKQGSPRQGAVDGADHVEPEAPVAVRPKALQQRQIDRRAEPRTGRHDQLPVDELDGRRAHVRRVETRSDVVSPKRKRGQ